MAVDLKRRLARGVAVITIALGAGHLVQTMSDTGTKQRVAQADVAPKAKHIETLAAGAETVKPAVDPALAAPRLPAAVATAPAKLPEPAITVEIAPVKPAEPAAVAEVVPAKPEVVQAIEVAADPCPVTLDLNASENAMVTLMLTAPCHPAERVVLKHAGLAVSAQTLTSGALVASLPALERDAKIEVLFKDGSAAEATLAVPEITSVRRFAVQYQADDAFQMHAFEDDAGYGGPGHVSGATPHLPAAGVPGKGGFLTLLGDSTTDLPLLAEVYTYPADPAQRPEVVVEAAVTETACGREILGETLTSFAGKVYIGDLTVAMPECDAVGDYLVLKNLVPDLNIAANN